MTFIAALRHDRIDAPWLLDAPMNGALFRTYVEKVLAPTLRPNDIVIADNLSSHTGGAVRRAIRAVGARLILLPKYSPDLNPIEQVFAKFKHLLRKAAKPQLAPARPFARQSANSSAPTRPTNAPTTSETQAMAESKSIML